MDQFWFIDGAFIPEDEAIARGLLTGARIDAYFALKAAAEQMGMDAWKKQGRPTRHFVPTADHRHAVTLMAQVLKGTATAEEAMSWLALVGRRGPG